MGPGWGGSGPGKKPGTLNGAGPGHGSCPAGRVRVWKNPAQTRPVAIPNKDQDKKKKQKQKPRANYKLAQKNIEQKLYDA